MGTSSEDSTTSSSEDSNSSIHFLPVVTLHSNSRRDVELLRSSARSHLARTMHRQNKFKTGKSKAAEDPNKSLDRPTLKEGEDIVNQRKLVRYYQVPDKMVDDHTKMLLHYCRTCFWPGFGMGAATFHIPPFAFSYSNLVAQGPTLYHALLWQAAVNLNFNRCSRVTDVGSIKHYQQALGHIHREVVNPISEIGETTLYAILSLVGPEFGISQQNRRASMAFDPPLSKLAWIHAFSRHPLTAMHADALYHLVDLKGGIDKLPTPGFRADLNTMDLIRSSQKLRRPHFPVSNVFDSIKGEHNRELFFGHACDFQAVASNERSPAEIDRLVQLGLPQEMLEVMLDMRVWASILEKYQCRQLSNPDLSLMGSHRDLIQHRLLSTLPEYDKFGSTMAIEWIEDAESGSQINLGDLLQTGLLIFAIGVTFPITYDHAFQVTGQRLKHQLQREAHLLMDLGLHDLVLWLGMFVAMCAEQVGDDELGTWCTGFLCHVERVRCRGPLSGGANASRPWHEVRDHSLAPFLWSSVACDVAGELIWGQVQGFLSRPVGRNTAFM
ncbi:hypothetical protein NW754_003145 [Fusarium falciforme]|uniref:Uncharacterized protein n=1 Tax=Fusarium falciforme TaxID=195108 RepID=A0A9W8R2G8_9HYPO|nr:hypothetical protein NW754_003145 [Fusarium falciforme]KAJ4183267.1 hypothetical protein NW755_009756 [Fusarium falciforme]KAJ4238312.1 hypothetical protein NW757_013206 [Fusarium falciforme]